MVIVPPAIDWNWMKQRPQQLMQRLAAEGWTVFYCDRTRSEEGPVVQELGPRLWRVRHHERWLGGLWPSVRRERPDEAVFVWCWLPFFPAGLRKLYAADFLVYDCVDDGREWHAQERELAQAADLIFCASEPLLGRLARSYPGKPVELVRNGYDPQMGLHAAAAQEAGARPEAAGGKPLVGFVGAWAPWIDAALVREVAALPGAETVVIGPEFGRKYPAAERIRFLGLLPHDELAGWIRRFSVCLIPFRPTPIALAANPIKAYEYLAAGKPVVATDLPECREMRPYVDVAANRRAFVGAVARRLEQPGDAAARRQFALANTWERRAAAVAARLRALESARAQPASARHGEIS